MNAETLCAAMRGLGSERAEQCVGPLQRAMREFGITTRERAAMWLAQVGHESVSLIYFEEIASGAAYEGRADLGNIYPGDGVRFKGRGPIQLTGRHNYTQAGAALGLDLVGHPELAASPEHAFRVSAWWWANHGCNELADARDVDGCSLRINGGWNGIDDRRARYATCWALGDAVTPDPKPTPEPEDELTPEDKKKLDQLARDVHLIKQAVAIRDEKGNQDPMPTGSYSLWQELQDLQAAVAGLTRLVKGLKK